MLCFQFLGISNRTKLGNSEFALRAFPGRFRISLRKCWNVLGHLHSLGLRKCGCSKCWFKGCLASLAGMACAGLFRPFSAFCDLVWTAPRAPAKSRKRTKKGLLPRISSDCQLLTPIRGAPSLEDDLWSFTTWIHLQGSAEAFTLLPSTSLVLIEHPSSRGSPCKTSVYLLLSLGIGLSTANTIVDRKVHASAWPTMSRIYQFEKLHISYMYIATWIYFHGSYMRIIAPHVSGYLPISKRYMHEILENQKT